MLSLVVLLNLVSRLLNHVKNFLWLLTQVNNFSSGNWWSRMNQNLSSKLIFHKRMLIVQWPPCPSFPTLLTTRVSRGAPIIAIQIFESKPRNRFQPVHSETGRVIFIVMFGCTISSHGPDSSYSGKFNTLHVEVFFLASLSPLAPSSALGLTLHYWPLLPNYWTCTMPTAPAKCSTCAAWITLLQVPGFQYCSVFPPCGILG